MTQTLIKTIADFSTTLTTATSVGATTATLTSGLDADGIQLPTGTYGFTVDRNTANKEYFTATLTGSNLTAIQHVTRGTGVGTSGLTKTHRKGAEVIITDHVALKRMMNVLDGTTGLDASTPLKYDGDPTLTLDAQIATKKYVDALAIAGAPNASTTAKGIVELATQAQVDARTATGETGAALAVTPDLQRSVLHSDYVVDIGAANAYIVNPTVALTAYTTGTSISFKASATNTTTSTVNVSNLGVKTIKKLDGATNLIAGDIVAGQIVTCEYDGTNFQMTSPSSNTVNTLAGVLPALDGSALTNVAPSASTKSSFTAGQTITTGQPLSVLPYSTGIVTLDTKLAYTAAGTSVSTTFTVANNANRGMVVAISSQSTVSAITFNGVGLTKVVEGNSGSGRTAIWYLVAPAVGAFTLTVSHGAASTVTMNIYSYYNVVQSQPEASAFASDTSTTPTVSLAPLTNGAIIFGVGGQSGFGTPSGSGTAYVNNILNTNFACVSGDSGSLYPPVSRTMGYNTNGYNGAAACVCIASIAPVAASLTSRVYVSDSAQAITADGFIGFATEAKTVGQTIVVTTSGVNSNQSGLTIGKKYYITDSPGVLGQSAGTVNHKVGIATSATEILITNIW